MRRAYRTVARGDAILVPHCGPTGLLRIQVLSATSFYDTNSNTIYSLSTGAPTWSHPANATAPGAIAGTLVVLPTYLNQLVTEPY